MADIGLQPPAIDRFKNILSVARDIEQHCGGKSKQPLFTHSTFSVVLPPPNDITNDLLKMGLTFLSAQQLSECFKEKILKMKHLLEANIRKYASSVCTAESPPSREVQQKAASIFQQLYTKSVTQCTTETLNMVYTKQASAQRHSKKARQSFNQEFTPFLERYFDENAFPSHHEKVEMAQKAMMNYRQIDVWFQNRRSRAKKEGKSLKRFQEEPKAFEELDGLRDPIVPRSKQTDVIDLCAPEYDSQRDADENDMSARTPGYARFSNTSELLNKASPPHAFPSVYPPSCGYDPFPMRGGKCAFPPPVWMRHPAKPIERQPMMSTDDLIADFSQMNIDERPRKHLGKRKYEDIRPPTKSKRNQTSPKSRCSASAILISTRPLPAPLPALIRSTVSVPRPSPRFNLATSPPIASHAPTPPLKMAASLAFGQTALPHNATKRRKITPLPTRSPAGTSNPRRVSPSRSDPSTPSTPELSPSSRMSSFSSDYSPLSSAPSSTAPTPECAASSLPEHSTFFPVHCNLQLPKEVTGSSPTRSLSPVEGFPFD